MLLCAFRRSRRWSASIEDSLELAERGRRLEAREERCRERLEELSREIAAEEQAGSVPSEDELDRSRKVRDERFDVLCKELPGKGKSVEPLFEAARIRDYRSAVGAGRSLGGPPAARSRSSGRAGATPDRARTALGGEGAPRRARDARSPRTPRRSSAIGSASWREAGFEPLRPVEMRSWLGRREQTAALLIEEANLNEREAELERQTAILRRALGDALGAEPETPLGVSVERANERLDAERALGAQRVALAQQVAELEVRRDKARRELEREEQAAGELGRELAEVTVALGLAPELAPEEVESRLESRAELARVRAQTTELERRVAGMRRDVKAFDTEVAELSGLTRRISGSAWRARGDRAHRALRPRPPRCRGDRACRAGARRATA